MLPSDWAWYVSKQTSRQLTTFWTRAQTPGLKHSDSKIAIYISSNWVLAVDWNPLFTIKCYVTRSIIIHLNIWLILLLHCRLSTVQSMMLVLCMKYNWNRLKYTARLLTVRHTLVLDLEILVRPGTWIWEHIWSGDDNTLRPVVTPEEQRNISFHSVQLCTVTHHNKYHHKCIGWCIGTFKRCLV